MTGTTTERTCLTGPLEQLRGVIGREPGPDEAYVFEFDDIRERTVHTFGVRKPLRVEFYVAGHEVWSDVLQPWTATARHRCDRIIERGVREVRADG